MNSVLWDALERSQARSLAVVGMAKNTGKTVALNHLLEQAHQRGRSLGVTSIGRDGEDRDQVFLIPKPPVRVWPGQIVATAAATLERSKARVRVLGSTGIASPMGEIQLVKVVSGGDMEVAGGSRSTEQLRSIEAMRQCGCDLILLDGALGRSHHASPALAEAVLLSTGAALGGGLQDVVRKTKDKVALLGIAALQADAGAVPRQAIEQHLQEGGMALWDVRGQILWADQVATINAAQHLLPWASQAPAVLAVSGAVGRLLWKAVMALAQAAQAAGHALLLVVQDGTRLFIDASDLNAFQALGGQVKARTRIGLLGLSTNPFSPLGGHLQAQALRDAIREAIPMLPVTDVWLEAQQEQRIQSET